ncbi:hypothetical protein MRX96_018086 [Rhipicephalus microplus]
MRTHVEVKQTSAKKGNEKGLSEAAPHLRLLLDTRKKRACESSARYRRAALFLVALCGGVSFALFVLNCSTYFFFIRSPVIASSRLEDIAEIWQHWLSALVSLTARISALE